MREALYFRNINFSAFSQFSLAWCSLITSPATLDSLSDVMELGGGARYI